VVAERQDDNGWSQLSAEIILDRRPPEDLLEELVLVLLSPPSFDREFCERVGCGDLESLLQRHETDLWPSVEHLARTNRRFAVALTSVWAFDSPMFEDRQELLLELGLRD
jgi:hypothetical protein